MTSLFDSQFGPPFFEALASIIFVNLVLSTNNMVVVGAAAAALPKSKRVFALVFGCVGAIALRIALTTVVSELLVVSLVKAICGVILLFIAIRLLIGVDDATVDTPKIVSLPAAIGAIIAADVTQSIDNIIAVGGIANGNLLLLVLGLATSITIVFLASFIVARIIERLYLFIDVAACVVAYTAANLFISDPLASSQLALNTPVTPDGAVTSATVVRIGIIIFLVVIDLILRLARRRTSTSDSTSYTPDKDK
jgi:YjbE family integral membrane protein